MTLKRDCDMRRIVVTEEQEPRGRADNKGRYQRAKIHYADDPSPLAFLTRYRKTRRSSWTVMMQPASNWHSGTIEQFRAHFTALADAAAAFQWPDPV